MYSLILDSATKVLYVALVNDDKIIYEKYVEGKNDHAKNIVFCVDEATKAAGITSSELNEVVVGVGPGSYTGVRMAVTVAKMIASFMNIPLYKVSTLKLMASGSEGKVLATIDARRGSSFGAVISNGSFVVTEALYETEMLLNSEHSVRVTEDSYKVNPFVVLKEKELVPEVDLLVPNYLRDTEAERNLNDKTN